MLLPQACSCWDPGCQADRPVRGWQAGVTLQPLHPPPQLTKVWLPAGEPMAASLVPRKAQAVDSHICISTETSGLAQAPQTMAGPGLTMQKLWEIRSGNKLQSWRGGGRKAGHGLLTFALCWKCCLGGNGQNMGSGQAVTEHQHWSQGEDPPLPVPREGGTWACLSVTDRQGPSGTGPGRRGDPVSSESCFQPDLTVCFSKSV